MSNSPWGPPPPNENPYGQQHPGQERPAHGSSDPHSGLHDPYAGPREPYPGAGPYGAPTPDPDRRPGTVTAAAVITFVFGSLGALLLGLSAIALVVAREAIGDEITRQIESDPAFDNVQMPDAGELTSMLVAVLAVLALWCLLACLFAAMAMRRSNAGRILLVISAGLSAILSLLAILSGISALTLIASVAVVVLLFTGGANDWFARRSPQQPLPPGTTQPWA